MMVEGMVKHKQLLLQEMSLRLGYYCGVLHNIALPLVTPRLPLPTAEMVIHRVNLMLQLCDEVACVD
jgi:hypothetical protein